MCDCIEKVNTAVRERYEDPEAELNVGFTFGTNTLAVKPSGLAATYRRKKKDGSYGIVKYTAMPRRSMWCQDIIDAKNLLRLQPVDTATLRDSETTKEQYIGFLPYSFFRRRTATKQKIRHLFSL